MKSKKGLWLRISLLALTLALMIASVYVTYSWMEEGRIYDGKKLNMEYGSRGDSNAIIGIQSAELAVNFYIAEEIDPNTETRPYVEKAGKTYVLKDTGKTGSTPTESILDLDGMLPSDAIYFMIEYYNVGEKNVRLTTSFAGIKAEKCNENGLPKLAEVLYLSLTGSDGYEEHTELQPANTFNRVDDVLHDGIIRFTENMAIPPTGDVTSGTPVRLYGYLLFDRNADCEYENCDFSIKNILIVP